MSAEAGRRPSFDEVEIFRHLKSEYEKAVSTIQATAVSPSEDDLDVPRATSGPFRGRKYSSDDDEEVNNTAAGLAAVKVKSEPQRSFFGSKPLPSSAAPTASGMDITFRRRRLTFATQGNLEPHTPLALIQQRVFRSLEIGATPKIPLPFPDTIVGTYSCHGIEPSYLDSKPFVAKINQDRGAVVYPFARNKQQAMFAVFDGHGEVGDKVSEYCMFEVPRLMELHSKLDTDVVAAFKEVFLQVDANLVRKPDIEAFYSGTTAVVGLMRDNQMWVANCGDSRCTMGTLKNGKLVAKNLSIDQNPDVPAEMDRITKAGGFVSPPPEPGLSARVWLDPDFTQVGLAMARSIGDHAVKAVGVIAEPEVLNFTFTDADKFLIFASDGVWEFITSDEAVTIVGDNLSRGPAYACQMLIENAAARWRDVEGDYRDDITALVIRLPPFQLATSGASSTL